MTTDTPVYTAFDRHQRVASGTLQVVALAVNQTIANDPASSILVFDDTTGHLIDIEAKAAEEAARDDDSRHRGRPKLGVVAREVTLLPRHWEWLAEQPGGASVALRKLVDEARRTHSDKDRTRKAQERAYRFISALAGNLPDFEEATRALFANDLSRFNELMAEWPQDLREYAIQLATREDNPTAE